MPAVINNMSLTALHRLSRHLVYNGASIITAVIIACLLVGTEGLLHDPHNPSFVSLMATAEGTGWAKISATALAIAAVAAIVTGSFFNQKARRLASRIRELEASLAAALEKGASERRGRTRAQQALRNALTQQSSDGSKQAAASGYPMAPIGTVRSCFSTRNGTPRQPLLVPLARACLVLDPGRVPKEALEGLAEYSHCWILYVFHLNTDLDKLWREPSRSKFKAKVRVPRLKGGKMGVLATRSPHRPCPIGLTVAKVEALDGQALLLSGVDLVDGTPVLDIKPYLPYSDSIQGATVPNWVKADSMLAVASVSFSPDFSSSLSSCWMQVAKQSLYASQDEFQDLIKELLSWDIRSLSQLNHPHNVSMENGSHDVARGLEGIGDEESCQTLTEKPASSSLGDVIYHLVVEEIDISYRIDDSFNIVVEKASSVFSNDRSGCHYYNYTMWKNKLRIQDRSATNHQRVEMQEGRCTARGNLTRTNSRKKGQHYRDCKRSWTPCRFLPSPKDHALASRELKLNPKTPSATRPRNRRQSTNLRSPFHHTLLCNGLSQRARALDALRRTRGGCSRARHRLEDPQSQHRSSRLKSPR